ICARTRSVGRPDERAGASWDRARRQTSRWLVCREDDRGGERQGRQDDQARGELRGGERQGRQDDQARGELPGDQGSRAGGKAYDAREAGEEVVLRPSNPDGTKDGR